MENSSLSRLSHEQSFSNVQLLDEDGLVDRVLSTSFIAALSEQQRRTVEEAVRGLVREREGRVAVPYSTDVQLFRRLEPSTV